MMVLNQNLAHIKNSPSSTYKHCVNKSRDKSRDNFAKNRELLTNWWPVSEKKSGNNIFNSKCENLLCVYKVL